MCYNHVLRVRKHNEKNVSIYTVFMRGCTITVITVIKLVEQTHINEKVYRRNCLIYYMKHCVKTYSKLYVEAYGETYPKNMLCATEKST